MNVLKCSDGKYKVILAKMSIWHFFYISQKKVVSVFPDRSEAFFHFSEFTGQYILSVINQENLIAELFCIVHQMRGKDDTRAFVFHFKQNIFNDIGVHRIQSHEWLVQDQ